MRDCKNSEEQGLSWLSLPIEVWSPGQTPPKDGPCDHKMPQDCRWCVTQCDANQKEEDETV